MTPADLEQFAVTVADRVADRLAAQPRTVDRHGLAEILGVSVPTIERLQRAGAIPVLRMGRSVRYVPDSVIDALASAEDRGPGPIALGDNLSPEDPGGEA